MLYSVTVKDSGGGRRTVLREAESVAEASAQLRSEGMLVLEVNEAQDPAALPGPWHPSWLLPMTGLDVELGLRQAASMLKSGVSLLETFRTVGEQGRCPRARRTWARVRDRVLAGDSLGDAMAAQSGRFGELAVRLARVGEQSGELDQTLLHAAEQLEAGRNLRTLVINALLYPVLAVTMALGVSCFLVTAVIPKIAAFLQANGAQLPEMTQLLVDVSSWMVSNGAYVLTGLAAAVALWLVVRTTTVGREAQDALLLRLPVAGNILRLSGTAVFARGMQTMIASGVSLLDALEVGAKLMANRRFRRRIEYVRGEVVRGSALATALTTAREFPAMLSRMAAVGEVTGSLSETFGETARFHETLLGVAVRRFSVLVEPVLIAITGVIVGFVYIAFFMAIFALAGAR